MSVRKKYTIVVFYILFGLRALSADTYIVTTTADEGDNSLRWAITQANQHAGADTIVFNIPDTDTEFDGSVWWIKPKTMLPVLTDDSTWVMGQSQQQNQGDRNSNGPEIVIYGGEIADPNQGVGFMIQSSGNIISGLVISGFDYFGIRLKYENTRNNWFYGNYIGTDPSGEEQMGNITGIYISKSAGSTLIGGGGPDKRNVISGNMQHGIYASVSDSNRIIGNYIGTDRTGTKSVPNGRDGKHSGITLSHSNYNLVGGTNEDTRNIISGNGRDGIHISQSDSNTIIGNYIGVDVTGTELLANGVMGVGDGIDMRYGSCYNVIGGTNPGEKNVVCGAPNMGIRIGEAEGSYSTDHNIIVGNYVGTDVNGEKAFGNHNHGIYILQNAKYNRIGSVEPGGANVVCSNSWSGIAIFNSEADSNIVEGNIVGLTASGDTPLPNNDNGILISDSASFNIIGPGNIVGGNLDDGIELSGSLTEQNRVYGNFVGVNSSATDSIPNLGYGLHISFGSNKNIIGDTSLAKLNMNIISGNRKSGLFIDSSFNNYVEGNLIGTDATGQKSVPNHSHGMIVKGAGNMICKNVVSGNTGSGICMTDSSFNNTIAGNKIGITVNDEISLPNNGSGIFYMPGISAEKDTIGPDNVIRFNGRYGVEISDSGAGRILITENSITKNDSGGIVLKSGANNSLSSPVITQYDPVAGTAPPNSVVEIYSDSGNQGEKFEAKVNADANGNWTWNGTAAGPYLTATASDINGNTSIFSGPYFITSVQNHKEIVTDFSLSQNYPNPFNPETEIAFSVLKPSHVVLKVYNLRGELVKTLINKELQPGVHKTVFKGRDMDSGVYLYRIRIGTEFSDVKKMLLIK